MGKHYEIDADTGKEKGGTFCITFCRADSIGPYAEWIFAEITVPANWKISIWQINIVQRPPGRNLIFGARERETGETWYSTELGSAPSYFVDGEPLSWRRRGNQWVCQLGVVVNVPAYAENVWGYALISIEEEG